MKNIAIIGAGNMGSAFYQGLIKKISPQEIFVCDHDLQKLKKIAAHVRQKISANNFSTDINKILAQADIIILAVKPQSFDEFCASVTISLQQKLIISIMAGISIATLRRKTGASKIVRSMPNLAAQVGASMTGWVAKNLTAVDRKFVTKIFDAIGISLELRNEKQINAVTALSGSGPAYFFYLCEIMASQARAFGFSQKQAEIIARQTLIGAAEVIRHNPLSAAELRKAVTSKGGTTEAAFHSFVTKKFDQIVKSAIVAAYFRAENLFL